MSFICKICMDYYIYPKCMEHSIPPFPENYGPPCILPPPGPCPPSMGPCQPSVGLCHLSMESSQLQMGPSQLPMGPSQLPMGPSQVPMGPSQVPMGPTQVPMGPSQMPMGPSQMPMGPSQVPMGTSQVPSQLPVGPSQLSKGPSQPSMGHSQPPMEPCQPSLVPYQPSIPIQTPFPPHPMHASQIIPDISSINQRLLELSIQTGYDCIQKNGQRHYGPPPNWNGPPPARGSEVFVGKIPRDCFEDELVPLFSSVAPIYEMRLMMNFTGYNRGFAFVQFIKPSDAWLAVSKLNNYEIRPGHVIGVSKSIDNCRLYIGNIPTDKTKSDAWEEITKYLNDIKDIIMYPSLENRKNNRGFLFLEFTSHRSAAMAKRQMSPGTIQFWNQPVMMDWADPEPDVNPNILAQVTKLFIRNLSSKVNDQYLKKILIKSVPPHCIQKIYIGGCYAFIHFDSRGHAEKAKEALSRVLIDGNEFEVHWARPRNFKKMPQAPKCRSLPPRLRKNSGGGNYIKPSPTMMPLIPYYPPPAAFHHYYYNSY